MLLLTSLGPVFLKHVIIICWYIGFISHLMRPRYMYMNYIVITQTNRQWYFSMLWYSLIEIWHFNTLYSYRCDIALTHFFSFFNSKQHNKQETALLIRQITDSWSNSLRCQYRDWFTEKVLSAKFHFYLHSACVFLITRLLTDISLSVCWIIWITDHSSMQAKTHFLICYVILLVFFKTLFWLVNIHSISEVR